MVTERTLSNLSLEEMDRRGLFHPNTDLRAYAHGELGDPHIIRGGEGIRIHDQHGKEYIDAFAGLWCVNIGYGRPEIAQALHDQAQRLAYYHTHWAFSNEPVIRLTDRVLDMVPPGMSKIFWGLQGSDAHETQVKIAWYYNNVLGRPEKKKIIARDRGYHGLTIMSGSLSGLPVLHETFDLPTDRVRHTMAPYYYRREDRGLSEARFSSLCAERLNALIEREGADTVAAFIAEPVVGVGRHHSLAGRLLAGDPGGSRQARRAADGRRGGLRLRPHGDVLRLRFLRYPARHDVHLQGPDERLLPPGRERPERKGLGGAGAGLSEVRALRARLHLRRPSARRRRGAGKPRDPGA